LHELGSTLESTSTSIESARVELLAGDLAAAEAELRRDDSALAAIDERYFRSTIAAILANVLWLRGDRDAALSYSELAETIADSDDIWSQLAWRTARARVLADLGQSVDALRLAVEAVALTDGTEEIELRADALAALAEVESRLDHPDEARHARDEARALY